MAVAHRIYARSLLEAARDGDRLERVREDFAAFAAAAEASPELRNLLRNPQIDPRAKRDALEAILEGADGLFLNFVRLLVEKHRIDQLEEIYAEWQDLLARAERTLKLELTTAVELSDEEAARIARAIEDASGRKVDAVRRTDPSLIGGVVVQAGSLRVDGSVRGRLNQLRRELNV
ncbi:MAG TPA: ATP synthase F1 subunit delta [Gaiellaceae bacterium]|nr:ATP synthase F1 subunit delta [Gaiellaceae bacterium]